MELLSRDEFRKKVFERDGNKCVICKKPAKDAHHIMERRLFDDGGYYLDNGASLCEHHHIKAEETNLSCEEIREACGINNIVLPDHLYKDHTYDKWGNPILNNGLRSKGELFYDGSVQKILKQGGVINLFSKYVKYPRTYHAPWSEKVTSDDKKLDTDEYFHGKDVVVTVKMDGENTTFYNDHIHARSVDSGSHPSRNKVKEIWSNVGWQLSDDERICGENLYAKHSIYYKDLPSYFLMFSHWEKNTCLSWEETKFNAKFLGLHLVPVIYEGIYDREKIIDLYEKYYKSEKCEGYVIRLADEFEYMDFSKSVMKYVDPRFMNKVNESHGHWMSKKITPNKIKEE